MRDEVRGPRGRSPRRSARRPRHWGGCRRPACTAERRGPVVLRRQGRKEVRVEKRAVFCRKLGIDRVEGGLVVRAVVGRRVEPDQQDREACVPSPRPGSRRGSPRASAGSRPRSRSLPPSATIIASTSGVSVQSTRASPPAVVSPETPAFTSTHLGPLRVAASARAAARSPARAAGRSPASGCRPGPRS